MSIYRVNSSDIQVHVNDTRLSGVQSVNFDASKEFTELQSLGKFSTQDRILNSNQTINVSMDYLLVASEDVFDPFFSLQSSGIVSSESFDLKIIDTAGENLISGAYLSSYSVKFGVRELPVCSIAYEANTINFNAENKLLFSDQTQDSFEVYSPKEIHIFASDFNEQINSQSFCVQSASISFNLDRSPKKILGNKTPQYRYPNLPTNGELSFSIIKHQITGIDLSSLVLNKGTLEIALIKDDSISMSYLINNCSLVSISESTNLDQDTTIDFNYVFSLNNDSISFGSFL